MSRNGKVVVAMSGGVDSSVAACLLKEQGFECVGVFMRVGGQVTEARRHEGTKRGIKGSMDQGIEGVAVASASCLPSDAATFPPSHVPTPARGLKHGCCSVNDALDARAVATRLGIPFYVLNFQTDFERIIEYFVDEYARARTPNPCVMCNTQLKFGKLLRYADMLEAEFVATGHYARVIRGNVGAEERGNVGTWEGGNGGTGGVCLARARNLAKDQSYVLFGIRREDLRRCLFPLGDIADKAEVRRIAAELGLRVHDKPESQEICFVPDNDYKVLVRQRRPETRRPGEVRDRDGRVLGTHDGIVNFTIGQRRGLRIAAGKPVYVTKLDLASNTVTLGPREDLLSSGLIAERVNWLVDAPAVGEWRPAAIKIRHMHAAVPGAIRVVPAGIDRAEIGSVASGASPDGDGRSGDGPAEHRSETGATVDVRFDEPQLAVTPGQAAVFYAGDIVLGGGWIERAG